MIGGLLTVKVIPLDDIDDEKRYQRRISALVSSIVRSIPGSRGFGLSGDFLDENVNEVAGAVASELQEQLDIYIPEISIESVDAEAGTDGRVELSIYIERRD